MEEVGIIYVEKCCDVEDQTRPSGCKGGNIAVVFVCRDNNSTDDGP
jgi:hypothetical protein